MSKPDSLFEDLVEQVREIITRTDSHKIISIKIEKLLLRGYHDISSFEEDFLTKVYNKVSLLTKTEFEIIKDTMRKRVEYIG